MEAAAPGNFFVVAFTADAMKEATLTKITDHQASNKTTRTSRADAIKLSIFLFP